MSVQVRRRREAAAFLSTFVGAQGELLVDTTNNRVQVHDGVTPGGWPAAKLDEIVFRTAVADANYTALATDRTIAVTALTAARTITLPAASAYPTGTQMVVVDESGACSATRTLTLARAGTDTINGATSAIVALAYGFLAVQSDGVSKWTIVDQSTASLAQQAASSVAITGGAINATTLGATTASTAKVTTLNASGAVSFASTLGVTGVATLPSVNVDGGTIDGTAIGSATPSTGAFTTLGASGAVTLASTLGVTGVAMLPSVNIDGGTIDGTAIGSSTPSTAKVTTLSASGAVTLASTLNASGVATLASVAVSAGTINGTTVGATTPSTVKGTIVAATTSVNLPIYTVATLPAAGTAGRAVFCSNARMVTSTGALETSGAGTGGLLSDNGTAWKVAGTNITASA